MTETVKSKVVLNGESKIQTEHIQEKQYHEGNSVVKAQKQMSSQETVGVFSPQQ